MGQHNLTRIFKPQQIAVIGASEKHGTIGHALMTNLLDENFTGIVYAVNPRYQTIHGLPALGSVAEMPEGVDLVVIATPIATVPGLISDCVKRAVGGAVVLSAGGKEAGTQGRRLEQDMLEAAGGSGLRIIGPNCLGLMLPGRKLNATFVSGMPEVGNLAFVSQSGGICSAIHDLALKEHIGFSHFVSIGSMIDVDFGDLIDYFGNDPAVKSILLYIEHLTNIRKFMSAARSVSRVKPIIVLKAGRSAAGARAAASHTGALMGDDAVYDAAFKRAGIVRVESIEELFDCAELMAKQPRPRGNRLAIITNGGGPGVMAVDFLAGQGHSPVSLDADTKAKIDEILPPNWNCENPIDLRGDASPEIFRRVLQVCLNARIFDGVLLIMTPQALAEPLAVAETLVSLVKDHRYPVFVCLMGGKSIARSVELLNEAGIPTFDTPERSIRAFLHMVRFTRNLEALLEIPPKLTRELVVSESQRAWTGITGASDDGFLSPEEVWRVLSAYGFPVVPTESAETIEQAVIASRKMGYPVVLKLRSEDITHKTEAGGVCLDVRSDTDVWAAYHQILSAAHTYKNDVQTAGVTIQPYHAQADYEIMLGAKRNPDFGPVILFGMGGIFAEVLKDRALGLPPMNRLLAQRMMQDTRVYELLKGFRNRPSADFEQIEEMIMRLSQMLIDNPHIAELDMNPILIKKGKALVVDARILVSRIDVPSPLHLSISPYPQEHEYRMVTDGGHHLLVRPVRPEDAPLFNDLFKVLSPTSIYYRFFSALTRLQPEMLSRFTQIDYDREIALVAIDEDSKVERMLGVARIIGDPDSREGEFAVLVGDAWQGQGIGASLLKKCIAIAEQRGFRKIYGIVLRENRQMLALGKRLGFQVRKDADSGEYELLAELGSQTRNNPTVN